MTRYRFLREALSEYEDAIEYYERAQGGLGDTFILDVERVLAVTLEFPEIGSPVADTPPDLNVRRRIVQRFGVEIDYVVGDDEIVASRSSIASVARGTGAIGSARSARNSIRHRVRAV